MRYFYSKLILWAIVLIFFPACEIATNEKGGQGQNEENRGEHNSASYPTPNPISSHESSKKVAYNYAIIHSDSIGFGYDIYVNHKLYIHQPHIPALSGERGFKSPEEATKVAELTITKLEKNILPPTVTTEELKQLGIF
jgi:hypothetical protein